MPVSSEGSYMEKVMRLFLLLITLSECRKNDISSRDNRTFADNEYPVCSAQNDSFNTYELSGEEGTNLTFLIFLLCVMFLSGVLAIFSNGMVILAHFKYRQGIFERSIVSLAWVDLLTGMIGTPIVCCIYYFQCKEGLGCHCMCISPFCVQMAVQAA